MAQVTGLAETALSLARRAGAHAGTRTSHVTPLAKARAPHRLWAIVWLALLSVSLLTAADDASLEYRVKAAFLLNFTKFIEWPAAEGGDAESPINICIVGDDPFGPALDRMVEGEAINGRKVTVQRVRREAAKTCQVVFVTRTEKEVAKTVATLGTGILTVGEGETFLKEGGMIAFVIESRRVRFDINRTAAESAGIKLSSKLLSVARSVDR